MAEQTELNMGVADQSRISMTDSMDNTPSNSNDLSIDTEITKRKEKKWILDLLFGDTLKRFLKMVY